MCGTLSRRDAAQTIKARSRVIPSLGRILWRIFAGRRAPLWIPRYRWLEVVEFDPFVQRGNHPEEARRIMPGVHHCNPFGIDLYQVVRRILGPENRAGHNPQVPRSSSCLRSYIDGSRGIPLDPIPYLSIPSLQRGAPLLLEQAGGPQVALVAVPVEEDEHDQRPGIGSRRAGHAHVHRAFAVGVEPHH
jgi:hypothetical protein